MLSFAIKKAIGGCWEIGVWENLFLDFCWKGEGRDCSVPQKRIGQEGIEPYVKLWETKNEIFGLLGQAFFLSGGGNCNEWIIFRALKRMDWKNSGAQKSKRNIAQNNMYRITYRY